MTGLIRVTDYETTGTPEVAEAEIIEIGTCDLLLDGMVMGREWSSLVRPVGPIPPETRAVHHISPAMVKDAPQLREVMEPAFYDGMESGGIMAAHNADFERHFTPDKTLPFICTYKCARIVWPDAPSHGNQALRYWLGFDEMPDFDPVKADPPHRAGPDAYTTAFLLRELLKHKTVPQLLEISKYPAVLKTMNFGKHKGMTFAEAPTDYLEWLRDKSEMGADVKFTARRELQRRQKARENQVKGD